MPLSVELLGESLYRTRLHERINKMLNRRWLTNDGIYVQEFERRIADMIGVRHCIAMYNGTVVLEIVICATGLKWEVIVPAIPALMHRRQ